MRKVIIRPYPSEAFPWEVKTKGYTSVYESLQAAKNAVYGRFGNCKIEVKDKR